MGRLTVSEHQCIIYFAYQCPTDEGRVNLSIHEKDNALSRLFQPYLSRSSSKVKPNEVQQLPNWLASDEEPPPPLNVVIQIVGSRGDVQPFVALGKNLKENYGHRVRLATHAIFKSFVEENGLEFFNIGGDPAGLMDYSRLALSIESCEETKHV